MITSQDYFNSKDPRIVALQSLPDMAAKISEAATLDANGTGLIIDWAIDIWGWDPVLVMGARKAYGYTWCPAGFQPNPPLADLADPSKAWPRSIKVSVDLADYPPFAPPPPALPVNTSPIGTLNGDAYSVNIPAAQIHGQWLYRDGQPYTDTTGTYIFHNVPGMFGAMVSWTKN
jgi:hypothetical protein